MLNDNMDVLWEKIRNLETSEENERRNCRAAVSGLCRRHAARASIMLSRSLFRGNHVCRPDLSAWPP